MSFANDPALREMGIEEHEAEAVRLLWRKQSGLPADHPGEPSSEEALLLLNQVRQRAAEIERHAIEAFERYNADHQVRRRARTLAAARIFAWFAAVIIVAGAAYLALTSR